MMTTVPAEPPGRQASPMDLSPIALLEVISRGGRFWNELAPRYGVTNPDPPWKTSLSATCDCLAASGALDGLDRRNAEDHLSETLYREAPAPERQLLALAHTVLSRGLIGEDDLALRMEAVRSRLNADAPGDQAD